MEPESIPVVVDAAPGPPPPAGPGRAVLRRDAGARRRLRAARPRPDAGARPPRATLLALLALYGCWGAATPAMKLMVATAPPLTAAGVVFLTGAVVLGALAAVSADRPRARPSRSQVIRAAGAGAVMLVGGQGLATVALTRMTTSLVAVLEATIPLWVVVLAFACGARTSRASLLRIAVGFAGVATVLATAPRSSFHGSGWALVAAGVAPVLWATGTLLQTRGDAMPADPRTATAIGLAAGGAALLGLAAAFGQLDLHALAHVSASSIAAAATLLVLDSLAGFSLYTRLLRTAPAPLVSTYAYVVPIVAVLIGVVAFGDHLWAGAILGAAVVLATIALELRGG